MNETPQRERPSGNGYDWRAILYGISIPLLYWILALTLITLVQSTGVACLTPLAWVLGIPAGNRTYNRSLSPDSDRKIREAGISGVLLGFLQSLLFAAATYFFLGGVGAWTEMGGAGVYALILGAVALGGTTITGMLAASAAVLQSKKAQGEEQP